MSRIRQLIEYLFLGIFYIFLVKKISNNNKMFENISNFNLKAIIKYILNNTINVVHNNMFVHNMSVLQLYGHVMLH